jgi:hypothetical protein
MAFCEQCGTKLNEGAKFCSNCGAGIQTGKKSSAKAGKCKLTIERAKLLVYPFEKFNVYIDGQSVKKLKNGECFSTELSNGKHNIYFTGSLGTMKTPSFEFTGDSNEIKYTVSAPSGVGFAAETMLGNVHHRIIANKILESEPGSYDN